MKVVNVLIFSFGISIFPTPGKCQGYATTNISNPLVDHNIFIKSQPDTIRPASFRKSKALLPEPIWPKRPVIIECYWKAWELAFSNLRVTTKENGFIKPYIDPAFNGHIFMWDTSFMVLFGRYGSKAFNFQGSLDNFYHKQHEDGYICREISALNGNEIFEKYDPSSTGPNIVSWAEWEYYLNSNDLDRLRVVFDPLLAYYQWFRTFRSWPDGSYFATGWGCGMDNQPRVPGKFHKEFSTAYMSWIDTSLQQVLSGKTLIAMAECLNRKDDVMDIVTEVELLSNFINKKMWDDQTSYYYDRFRDGSLSNVKSIASYWALLSEVVPENKLNQFVQHLQNTKEFSRLHRIPTLSADNPEFKPDGNYWQGGVWAPTSYMVLRGLTKYGQDSLAYEIALNHLGNVVKVFKQTGTLWENYAPDMIKGMYRKDMVGWTGLVPISVLFEYIFGLRPNASENTITWDIRLIEEFGVKRYPYRQNGVIDFWCDKRKNKFDMPVIKVKSNVSFDLQLKWNGGSKLVKVQAS